MEVARASEQGLNKGGYRHTCLPPGGGPLSTFAMSVGLLGTSMGLVL